MKHRETIGIVTAWYNEDILAPLFLLHYSYADKILVLLDMASSSAFKAQMVDLQAQYKSLCVRPVHYPHGIDWLHKSAMVNQACWSIGTDWVYAVDADEFIFAPMRINPFLWLGSAEGNVIKTVFFVPYRHRTDSDIDISCMPVPQRVHGNQVPGSSYGHQLQDQYIKPCVFRPSTGLTFSCGCHFYTPNDRTMDSPNRKFFGAHWCMADPALATSRRLAQKARQSKANLDSGRGEQNFHVTEEEIVTECLAHQDDDVIPTLAAY